MRKSSTHLSVILSKKYFADPNIHRNYDFDSGVVGPTVVNNIIQPAQQGSGQPAQPYGGGCGGGPEGYVPIPHQAQDKILTYKVVFNLAKIYYTSNIP